MIFIFYQGDSEAEANVGAETDGSAFDEIDGSDVDGSEVEVEETEEANWGVADSCLVVVILVALVKDLPPEM